MTGPEDSLEMAVRQFLADPAARRDPAGLYQRLLAEAPILKAAGQTWLISAPGQIVQLLGDDRCTLDLTAVDPPLPVAQSPALNSVFMGMLPYRDGSDHARLRRLAARAFSARGAAGLRHRIEAVVDELWLPALDSGGFDLIADIATPLPVAASCAMLGLDPADRPLLTDWAALLTGQIMRFGQSASEIQAVEECLSDIAGYLRRLLTGPGGPPPGLLADLAEAADAKGNLDQAELLSFFVLLLINGLETATNALGNAAWTLLQQPQLGRWLQDGRGGSAAVFDECLRLAGPVRLGARRVREGFVFHGHQLEPGDATILLFEAANLDPAVFDRPEQFRVDRPIGRHLGFGHGPHHCLGAPLARLLGETLLERIAGCGEAIRTPLGAADARWKRSLPFRGLESLPVEVQPSQRRVLARSTP
jgi:cytochrome P450